MNKKNCHKCGDTGVNDLGNNDIPCDCSAGDKALFNDVLYGQISGKALKAKINNSIKYSNSSYITKSKIVNRP